jgi:hypothetical protein
MRDLLDTILWWMLPGSVYSLMPSRCEVCKDQYGVRGNEKIINGKRVCDHCAAVLAKGQTRGASGFVPTVGPTLDQPGLQPYKLWLKPAEWQAVKCFLERLRARK